MGTIQSPLPVKLFVGVLTSLPEIMAEIQSRLTCRFGSVDMQSGEFPFDWTRYYDSEMGSPIVRNFLSFETLIASQQISAIKIATNSVEDELVQQHREVRRPVNLDPGYLEESKIVLASTKNFYHRILLSDGIYGEVTLYYQGGTWKAFPWSFPDFRSGRYDRFFVQMRQIYREQIKGMKRA